MSFINFESGREKDRLREELREARSELLKRAEHNAKRRQEQDVQKQLRGEDQWMLPEVLAKLSSSTGKKSKKDKKQKKSKKSKKKKRSSSNSDDSSSAEEKIQKKKKKPKYCSSSDTDTEEEDEWIEKSDNRPTETKSSENIPSVRDDWMTSGMLIPTYSSNKEQDSKKKEERKNIDSYDPTTSTRELNPFWRNGGSGLPTFQKPKEDSDDDEGGRFRGNKSSSSAKVQYSGNWRKKDERNTRDDRRNRQSRSPKDQSIKRTRPDDRQRRSKSSDRGDNRRQSRSPGYRHRRQSRSTERNQSVEKSRSPVDRSTRDRRDRHSKLSNRRKQSRSPNNDRRRRRSESHDEKPKKMSRSPSDRPKNDDRRGRHSKLSDRSSSETETAANPTTSSAESVKKNVEISSFLTDSQMNELGAKIIKAEIMGDDDLAQKLKEKLELARDYRNTHKQEILAKGPSRTDKKPTDDQTEDVLLTLSNAKGISRPLERPKQMPKASDGWGGRRGNKKSGKSVATHSDAGERLRFFADDDKYDIKQMFEKEKFTSAADQDEQFANIAGKHKNPNDDLEDIFTDKVRKEISDADLADKERSRAIHQHQQMAKTLDTCVHCFDSSRMEKQLIVSMGTNVYLCLPTHEPLQPGHCLIVPVQHVACSTSLDENVWQEVQDYQKAITRMFRARSQDVIFFETARFLNRHPHMVIHCVPNRDFELAPFYFKKAIQESEREWSTNKQLVSLKDKDLRRSIPKTLPYFWIQFGIDSGFAHVIEEQDRFPANFAQETIGGLLNLDPRMWRRPRKEQNPIPKVKQFADWWKPFDITKEN